MIEAAFNFYMLLAASWYVLLFVFSCHEHRTGVSTLKSSQDSLNKLRQSYIKLVLSGMPLLLVRIIYFSAIAVSLFVPALLWPLSVTRYIQDGRIKK